MQTAVSQKWEYRLEVLESMEGLGPALETAGNEGWELVNVLPGQLNDGSPIKTLRARSANQVHAIFKRPQ